MWLFDDELIEVMEKLKWWDKSIEEINNLIPILTSSDLEKVKEELSNWNYLPFII